MVLRNAMLASSGMWSPFLALQRLQAVTRFVHGVSTFSGAGVGVVDGKLPFGAAVLALVIVALEYVLPGKINALIRGVYVAV